MSNSMGSRIHDKRISMNLTMKELGDKVGVQASAVNKWEKGLVENIKQSTIKKIADVLEVSPAWLLMGDEPEGRYSYVDTDAAVELMMDPANQEIIRSINLLTEDEKKDVLSYIEFLINKRERTKRPH